jgi:uncharacterized membrane protein
MFWHVVKDVGMSINSQKMQWTETCELIVLFVRSSSEGQGFCFLDTEVDLQ